MTLPPLTPFEEAHWDNDRRPSLYVSLSILLVLNNLVAGGRLVANYFFHYRHSGFKFRHIFIEDLFMLLSAGFVDVVIGNLLAATRYGLGLHSWRVVAEDPHYPRNLSNAFKHVWIVMVLTGPTFTFIKLTLLYFYRRLFLVNQKWLKVAWWGNVIYVLLWFFGASGFYIFQCWPVQWYYMRYYSRYHVPPPYSIEGQCNATTVIHVAIPLIFGIVSDVAILLLPLVTISQLRMARKTKFGLVGVFSIGVIACALDMARIIELTTDTDDKVDPSYGVVIFLALSAATEVTAITCACLPVIVPAMLKVYKSHQGQEYPYGLDYSGRTSGGTSVYHRRSHAFAPLDETRLKTTIYGGGKPNHAATHSREIDKDNIPLANVAQAGSLDALQNGSQEDRTTSIECDGTAQIWVERQIEIKSAEEQSM
ncbi:hypothetical protein EV356DRAFT_503586 [Viridothelium virens]|uniref:Rhodopsin domain-containing protein n=1 Tax=Viridothelium virens TaxID=1048519 RepID=A0A6A6H727_VIRVR|nr:hypothetical protein EV356DRAFT_503586 [Viridothelium virens]